jgi:uncharacterized protein YndB with AHSA1/START domain
MSATRSKDVSDNTADRKIVVVRVFDAPRNVVWDAWSDPEQLKLWFGPNGFTNTFEEFDFRPGGHWRFVMHGPDGTNFKNHNQFIEIKKPELIVMDHLEEPKFRVTATFTDLGRKTQMTFRQVFDSAEIAERVKPYAVPGTQQTLDKLASHIAARR